MAKGRRKFKMVTCTGTVGGALDAAGSDVRNLHDDMENWASNMEGANMEHMPKYDEVSTARDALSDMADTLEGLDVPQSVADIEITYTEMKPYGRKSPSRSLQLSNIESYVSAAKDAIENRIQELRDAETPECNCENPPEEPDAASDEHELDCPLYREEGDDTGTDADDPDDLQSLLDEIDQIDWSVDFPGMFG